MKYTKGWSYGSELEYADTSLDTDLGELGAWNTQDDSIVNSNGLANDPKGKLIRYGGEINVTPTYSVYEQVDYFRQLVRKCQPTVNYRSNLHLHVRIPGLKDDIKSLKNLMRYVHENEQRVFELVEPIPHPGDQASKYAMKRYRRRFRSHQTKVSEERYQAIMRAATPDQFYAEHATIDKNGVRNFFVRPRAGINLRQLWETDTVEFRHFPGTVDENEFSSALEWCKEFLKAALYTDVDVDSIYDSRIWTFPTFRPLVDDRMEELYEFTSVAKNTRKEVAHRLKLLGNPTVSASIDTVFSRYQEINQ